MSRYQATDRWAFGWRIQRYSDPDQVVTTSGTPNGTQISGASVNADYTLCDNALWRSELQYQHAKDALFLENTASKVWLVTTSVATWF